VHRSEVYEEIQRTNRAAAGEPEPKAPAERAKVADLGKGRRAPSKE
jgi:sRNA-binding carbon storage regulator CsrA